MRVLTLQNVGVRYPGEDTAAIENVTFALERGEVIGIMGPSGCGKTTILNLICGFLEPSSGRIKIGEVASSRLGAAVLVFQEDSLFPWLRVSENVEYGLKQRGVSASVAQDRRNELLHEVGLSNYADYWPKHLSGGMKKRVEVARALAVGPEILLLDEPFSGLDFIAKRKLQIWLERICSKFKTSTVFVSHDVDEVVSLCGRVLLMAGKPGTIVREIVIETDRASANCSGLLAGSSGSAVSYAQEIRSLFGELDEHDY